MSVRFENIELTLKPNKKNNNQLNLTGLNVTDVEEYNNGRVSPVSDPGRVSPLQSFFQKAKKKVSNVFTRPSSPSLPFEQLVTSPLFALYESYLQNPSSNDLQFIRQEVKRLGHTNPVVQGMRSYAEGVFENAATIGEATLEKQLVNALGGSTLSSGGRRRTQKRRRSHKRKSTRRK